jgi:uncharacterized protein (TIGR02118 family)
MIKRISLVARQPGLTIEEFERHWTGPHLDIVRQLPKLRGCQLNLIQAVEGEREWDGIGELWFDSIEDARAAFASEPVRSLLAADRPQFIGRSQVYFVSEHVVIPPPQK